MVLSWSEEIAKPDRPQVPSPPFPYRSEEVTIQNSAADVTLAGTLTLPRSGMARAAAILISGSGAQNRDAEIMNHKPFLVLADYLTRRGIAVLRYDDRGYAESTGDATNSTSEDFADDVLAAVSFLTAHPDVQGAWIGLIGHSEGGIIAPLAATRSDDIDFLVPVAAPGLPGETIIMDQVLANTERAYQLALDMALQQGPAAASGLEEMHDSMIEMARSSQQRLFDVLKSESDSAAAASKLRAVLMERASNVGQAGRDLEAMVDAQISQFNTPWMRFFVTHDPRRQLLQVTCPVLAIGGDRDTQVNAANNLPIIDDALRTGGNADATVIKLEGLNHLMQSAETGQITEYATIEETMAPKALELIGDWILQRIPVE